MKDPRKHRWKVVQFIAHRLPPCRTVSMLISESRDRRLSVREWFIVHAHLTVCAFCTRYGRQIACLEAALKEAGDHPERLLGAQSCLSDTAKLRIRDRLDSAK